MDSFIKRLNCYGGNQSGSIDAKTRAATLMLSSSGSEKVPGDPGASIIMAVGEALIQSSGIGTDALVGLIWPLPYLCSALVSPQALALASRVINSPYEDVERVEWRREEALLVNSAHKGPPGFLPRGLSSAPFADGGAGPPSFGALELWSFGALELWSFGALDAGRHPPVPGLGHVAGVWANCVIEDGAERQDAAQDETKDLNRAQ
ncbi:hypothetical protein F5883DRAFT_682404 [Diaporthe sp. PMI_573]|nr:hypothetical protein F5883DRAFT_682404 [Diaporthaceae sp. PMI_573]